MSRRPPRYAVLAALGLASLAGAGAWAALGPVPALRADLAADVAELNKLAKDADTESKAVAKIGELEANPSAAVTEALADIARNGAIKSEKVRKTALRVAASRKHPELYKWLLKKLGDDKLYEDRKEVYLAVLDGLVFYVDDEKHTNKAGMKPLEDTVQTYLPKDAEVSKRAIVAYGVIRQKAVVEQLVKWLAQTDTKGGGSGAKMNDETKKLYGEARATVLRVLKGLTGEDQGSDTALWSKWWKEHEKTFEFPDENANVEPDWPTLKEFTDKAYGYTMPKPTPGTEFWHFVKPEDPNGRFTLQLKDAKDFLLGTCKALTWPSGEYGNPENFAKYFAGEWEKLDFQEWGKDGAPKITAAKIGGRDFTVLTARGAGKDRWKNWASFERRVYITQGNPGQFLYFECAVQSGAEPEHKKGLFDTIETMRFTEKK